jgi:hypothetical protein
MRSKLALSALVVTSLFGSTLLASAQSQTAPGASHDENAVPGANSKKAQRDKTMTTGSSTRSGTSKGGAANPSDQDNTGAGNDNVAAPSGNMAPPKNSNKY